MPELRLASLIVAIILAVLAAVPQVPYSGALLALAVAFLGLGHLL